TILHRASEGFLGPCSDAGFGIRRDVAGVDGPERRLERQVAGESGTVRTRVASGAIAVVRQHAAALDQGFVEGGEIWPRHRSKFALVGEDGEPGRPDQDDSEGRPEGNPACSHRSSLENLSNSLILAVRGQSLDSPWPRH